MNTLCLMIGVLALAPGKEWRSEPVTLKPCAQYRVQFRARIDGETTIERNPQVSEAFYDSARGVRGMLLPLFELDFETAAGRSTSLGILFPYWNYVYSGEWRTYLDGFNAPHDAARVRLRLHNLSKHDTLEFDPESVEVKEYASPYVNVNSDFEMGERCHAGFGLGGYGSLLKMIAGPDGKGHYMSVKTFCNMDGVPVIGGHVYTVDVKLAPWVTAGNGANVNVSFDGRKGEKIPPSGGTMTVKGKDGGLVSDFVAPTNALVMKMLIHKSDFEHIRVIDKGMAK